MTATIELTGELVRAGDSGDFGEREDSATGRALIRAPD